jgi:hypothetical protein
MIQLVILFLFIIFVISIILLYKKYIKIKNVVDDEQNRKYNKVKDEISSNNKKLKDMKKDTKEIINDLGNNPSSLGSRVTSNKEQIATNQSIIVDRNFESINSVFRYDSGLVIGGTAGHIKIGEDNIKLNVQNPTRARVCDDEKKCTNIITKQNVEDTWPSEPILVETREKAITALNEQDTIGKLVIVNVKKTNEEGYDIFFKGPEVLEYLATFSGTDLDNIKTLENVNVFNNLFKKKSNEGSNEDSEPIDQAYILNGNKVYQARRSNTNAEEKGTTSSTPWNENNFINMFTTNGPKLNGITKIQFVDGEVLETPDSKNNNKFSIIDI